MQRRGHRRCTAVRRRAGSRTSQYRTNIGNGPGFLRGRAFAAAPEGSRGNAPIGLIEGPHWYQWDLSGRKKFQLPGSATIEFRADVFNVFNRVNMNNPNVTVTGAEFGRIFGARIPRQTQLSFRLAF